jgi:hypothetical protein
MRHTAEREIRRQREGDGRKAIREEYQKKEYFRSLGSPVRQVIRASRNADSTFSL